MDIRSLHELRGAVAVVTGAGGGLGAATALALAQWGATVVATDKDANAAQRTAGAVVAEGGAASHLGLDIADEAAVDEAMETVAARYGRLDILVANAGIGARQPAEILPGAAWRRVVEVNLDGTFYCCRAVAKPMLARGCGSIVIVSSIMGLVGGGIYPNAAYQATKGALVNLTRTLALEWASRGIRVNAVAPTFARTTLTEKLLSEPGMEQKLLDNTPLGRLAEPVEIAAAIAFLASDAATMITGTTLP